MAAALASGRLRGGSRVLRGGSDEGRRGLRYVEWTWDPDPTDNTYVVDYAFLMRDADGAVHVEHDRHLEGLFAREDWLRLLANAGFQARCVPFEHSELEPGSHEVFVGTKPSPQGSGRTSSSNSNETRCWLAVGALQRLLFGQRPWIDVNVH